MAKTMDEHDQYNQICKDRFDEIITKLDDLNAKLFVGNGTPSIVVRMDRLEQSKESSSKIVWLAVSAFITAAAGFVWSFFFDKRV
jgi:hypothetical protein